MGSQKKDALLPPRMVMATQAKTMTSDRKDNLSVTSGKNAAAAASLNVPCLRSVAYPVLCWISRYERG